MNFKKINFKDKRYIFPLLAFPFLVFFIYVGASFFKEEDTSQLDKENLSLTLGDSKDSILSKNDAFDALFEKGDNRTLLDGLGEENDSLMAYSDLLSEAQKREIDSIKFMSRNNQKVNSQPQNVSYYDPKANDKDYQRSADIIKMLNENSYGNGSSTSTNGSTGKSFSQNKPTEYSEEDTNPAKLLKEQMLMMDSIEKSRDPEYQNRLAAEEKLKKNQAKMEAFLNSTFSVNKSQTNKKFNAVYQTKENNFIKAVIDENNKGYLGSRIRIRLLEDIYVGDKKIKKGEILYSQISGFSMQRVNLNIISVLSNGEILPINLSIYDMDGMQGLYVPQSLFRDMVSQMGSQSVQGMNLDTSGTDFFTSIGSKLFTSTSKSIANLIKTNKAKLKYNSYVYLIDQKDLKN